MLDNGKFSAGDEVLIRFRLFADALAHGWGWSIDNLSIQEPVTDTEVPLSSLFKVYPVPSYDHLVVEFLNPQKEAVDIQITDLQGRVIYSRKEDPGISPIQENIDLLPFKEGLYILKAKSQSKTYSRKFLKIGP